MEGYVQSALRKELHIAPLVERLKTTILGKSYRQILSVLEATYLNIVFLRKFCWWKVMYRMLYERSFTLLLS